MKTLLAAEENLFPNVFNCILSAIIPLMQHNSAIGCAMEWVMIWWINNRRDTPREMRGKLRNMLKERGIHYDPKKDEMDEDYDPNEEWISFLVSLTKSNSKKSEKS